MSDSDDSESDIPPRDVCEARCQEFAGVTGTDTALAMFYLQDRSWDLQRSLNAFFEESGGAASAVTSQTSTAKVVAQPTVQPTQATNQIIPSNHSSNSRPTAPTQPVNKPQRIRIMSWNIDGLDTCNLLTRTTAVCETIKKEKPDVVYLQEVIPRSQEIIEAQCPQYQVVQSHNQDYYTAVLLNCESATYEDHSITPFYTSKMGRNLLQVKSKVKGVNCLLMTSHLESTKSHANERVRQLKAAFKEMTEADTNRTVVFGGDLNLRDPELASIGGIPENICDLWEVTGKRPEAKFTWDTKRNDNVQMPGKFQPRCRFDRLYIRGSRPSRSLKPVYFELVGIERIPQCRRFPSDHWGLLAHFDTVVA